MLVPEKVFYYFNESAPFTPSINKNPSMKADNFSQVYHLSNHNSHKVRLLFWIKVEQVEQESNEITTTKASITSTLAPEKEIEVITETPAVEAITAERLIDAPIKGYTFASKVFSLIHFKCNNFYN